MMKSVVVQPKWTGEKESRVNNNDRHQPPEFPSCPAKFSFIVALTARSFLGPCRSISQLTPYGLRLKRIGTLIAQRRMQPFV